MTTTKIHLAAIDLINEEIAVAQEAIQFYKIQGKKRQREWQARRPYREVKADQKHRDIMRSLNLQRQYVAELEASREALKHHRKTLVRIRDSFYEKPTKTTKED